MTSAVVLLSGGLDSLVAAYQARHFGFRLVEAVSVIYGQKHRKELQHAARIAEALGVPHHVAEFPRLDGSALVDSDKPVPTDGKTVGVAPTFVPSRNAMFLTYAANRAVLLGAGSVVTGVNAVDYSGYPDCRPAFIDSMTRTLNLALGLSAFSIYAPLIGMTKVGIIRTGVALGAPLDLSWSCYVGGDRPCGVCDSCRIRVKAFADASISDPALEVAG